MVNEIIKSISVTLNRVFGDDFEVYFSKDVQQGLQEPCFIIALAGSSRIRRIGLRYQQFNSLVVQYFPAEKYGNTEMIGVAEQLFDALETIQLSDGDLVHGTAMNHSIRDGVLHFFVDFNMFLKKEEALIAMEVLSLEASVTESGLSEKDVEYLKNAFNRGAKSVYTTAEIHVEKDEEVQSNQHHKNLIIQEG